jgi:hypothetical protein
VARASCALAKAAEGGHRGLSVRRGSGGHQSSHGFAAPRDEDLLAAFDAVKEAREMRLCLGSSDGFHGDSSSRSICLLVSRL